MSKPSPARTNRGFALARWLMRACIALMPAAQMHWARAMAAELDEAPSAKAACGFALGCLGLALRLRLLSIGRSVCRDMPSKARALVNLSGQHATVSRLGATCACLAVLVGGVFMVSAGAPKAWPWMNGLSLAFALASLALLPRQRLQTDVRLREWLSLVLGSLLLASCALEASESLNGRWLRLGPVAVQAAWLLVPSLLLLSAQPAGTTGSHHPLRSHTGLLLAMAALWAQAEPSWLLLMGLVLLARSACRPNHGTETLLACLALLAAGLSSQNWRIPASQAFVDQVLLQAWSQGSSLVLSGLMLTASLMILLPGWRHRHAREHSLLWAGVVLLSLPGWLPTPLLGMGGSAILSYVLSLAALPGPWPEAQTQVRPAPQAPPARHEHSSDPRRRLRPH